MQSARWRPVIIHNQFLFMAKYRSRKGSKKAKSTGRRRRRVGALALNPSSTLVQVGAVAVGYLMAGTVNGALDKVVPTNVDAKLVAAGQLGLGAALAMSKKKTLVKTLAGGVLAGAGLRRAMTAFGIGRVGNYQSVPVVAGYQSVPALGASGSRRVNGYRTNNANLAGYNSNRYPVNAYGGGIDVM